MTKFEDFFKLDNRSERHLSPINQKYITEKYEYLLSEEIVKDKIVLDLGSCLGAAGHWVLSNGAKLYIGVEVQEDFVKTSTKLLSQWGSKASIIQKDLDIFLEKVSYMKFDIVILFGVIYSFTDQTKILETIFSMTNTFIMDSITPFAIYKGKIQEWPMIEYTDKLSIISDKGKYSFSGFTGIPSLSYIQSVAENKGFEKIDLKLIGEDYKSKTIYSYDSSSNEIPFRYYARFDKKYNSKLNLQEKIKSNDAKHITSDQFDINRFNDAKKLFL